ncbi:MAG: DUF2121 domain-containing protein [Methanolinea sp.]|nr:DUF2121 domain-containing protein [Methanolinea sp.]
MSLVIAFCGRDRSFMAGDRREIWFRGDERSVQLLEDEIYSGRIQNEEELRARARERGVGISIRDDRCKVWEEGGVLVGRVSERDGTMLRYRTLFVSCGHYAMLESRGGGEREIARGGASRFIVLGNRTTQDIARRCIQSRFGERAGTPADALRAIFAAMEEAAARTPSVSKSFSLVQTDESVPLPRR